ncbi:Heterokaryon incompatibility [Macrophomina phaseolina MS6]|uniref:Heterokaryon incompatibility n=1 Tax=Macrophomina phaseolina (strain MS6) TaxID=1126212 RepID=K2SR74_MACPH|nr:Heterokaryon incompatibility [Macrophomina phaseolina MS6]
MHVTPSALRSIEMATEHSCNVCNELAELTSASSDDSPVLLLEPEDLHRNVRQGCPFCGIIYCALTAWSGHKDIPINGVYLELGYYPSSEGVDLDGDLGRALKLEAFFTDDDCLKLEIFCAADQRPPFLHVSSGEHADYAALSHCWGGIVPIRTLQSNLKDHQSSIPLSTLPPTFRDAITIARSLNIPYLWIDSLCIIQDSASDWAREAASMGAVYCTATVTIAADGASNSHGGCFRPLGGHGKPLTLQCPAAPAPSRKGPPTRTATTTNVFIRPCAPSLTDENQHYDICHGFWRADDQQPQSALDGRAWVLQERLLARRILHYTNWELAWECDAAHRCECSFSSRAPNFRHSVLGGAHKSVLRQPKRNQQQQQPAAEKLSRQSPFDWAVIVQDFTARSLTQARDRLPALSGLAQLRAALTGDEYVCGLWRRNVAKWLWWKPAEGCRESRRIEPYYAPSWSWASVTASIWYIPCGWDGDDGVDGLSLIRDVSIDFTPATSSSFGPAESGSLRAMGRLIPCRAALESAYDSVKVKASQKPLEHPELGAVVESKSGRERVITWEPDVFYRKDASERGLSSDAEQWSFEVLDGSILFLLPTVQAAGVNGFVLQPDPGSTGSYQRVGAFWDTAPEKVELLDVAFEAVTVR